MKRHACWAFLKQNPHMVYLAGAMVSCLLMVAPGPKFFGLSPRQAIIFIVVLGASALIYSEFRASLLPVPDAHQQAKKLAALKRLIKMRQNRIDRNSR